MRLLSQGRKDSYACNKEIIMPFQFTKLIVLGLLEGNILKSQAFLEQFFPLNSSLHIFTSVL